MARDIKMDQKLSKEDRAYLVQRGAWGENLITRLDAQYGQDPDSLPDEPENAPNEALVAELDAARKRIAELEGDLLMQANTGTVPPPPEGPADEEVPPYEKWKLEDLNTEVEARNADRPEGAKIKPASTLKADVIAALKADDGE
jgi:hypothetical protein